MFHFFQRILLLIANFREGLWYTQNHFFQKFQWNKFESTKKVFWQLIRFKIRKIWFVINWKFLKFPRDKSKLLQFYETHKQNHYGAREKKINLKIILSFQSTQLKYYFHDKLTFLATETLTGHVDLLNYGNIIRTRYKIIFSREKLYKIKELKMATLMKLSPQVIILSKHFYFYNFNNSGHFRRIYILFKLHKVFKTCPGKFWRWFR